MSIGLKGAFAQLTVLPLAAPVGSALSHAMAYYPVVGAFLGAIGALVFYLAYPMGSVVAAILAVGAKSLVSGGKVRRSGLDYLAAQGLAPLAEGMIRYGMFALLLALEVWALSQANNELKGAISLVVAHTFAVAALPCLLQVLPSEDEAPDFAHAAQAAVIGILLGLLLAGVQGALAILGGVTMAAALVILARYWFAKVVHASMAPVMAAASGFVVLWLMASGS